MSLFRAALATFVLLAPLAPCSADPAPAIHYASAENLEHIDVALIDGARHEIDLAGRICPDRLADHESALAETPDVEIRVKRNDSDLMHLKSYQIDRRILCTGSANFSAAGRRNNSIWLAVAL